MFAAIRRASSLVSNLAAVSSAGKLNKSGHELAFTNGRAEPAPGLQCLLRDGSDSRRSSMATPNAPEQRPVLSKVEARQGVTGQNVRYVLWFGLAGVIIAFAAIYLFYFA